MLNGLFALLGLLFMYGMVLGLDSWTHAMQRKASQTFNTGSYFWASLVADLLIALGLILLAWFTNFRGRRSLAASLLNTPDGRTLSGSAEVADIHSTLHLSMKLRR